MPRADSCRVGWAEVPVPPPLPSHPLELRGCPTRGPGHRCGAFRLVPPPPAPCIILGVNRVLQSCSAATQDTPLGRWRLCAADPVTRWKEAPVGGCALPRRDLKSSRSAGGRKGGRAGPPSTILEPSGVPQTGVPWAGAWGPQSSSACAPRPALRPRQGQ